MKLPEFLNPFQQKEKEEETLVDAIPQPIVPTVQSYVVPPSFQAPQALDIEIQSHFENLMKEANIPGPDYIEFIAAVQNGGNALPENTLYQMIFNTFKTMGLSKEKLLHSIDAYKDIINKDNLQFDSEVEVFKKNECDSKEAIVNSNIDKLAALQEKIQLLTQENAKLQGEIASNHATIQQKVQNYKYNNQMIIQTLETNKQKINQYVNE